MLFGAAITAVVRGQSIVLVPVRSGPERVQQRLHEAFPSTSGRIGMGYTSTEGCAVVATVLKDDGWLAMGDNLTHDPLPRTPTGKLLKHRIRDEVEGAAPSADVWGRTRDERR